MSHFFISLFFLFVRMELLQKVSSSMASRVFQEIFYFTWPAPYPIIIVDKRNSTATNSVNFRHFRVSFFSQFIDFVVASNIKNIRKCIYTEKYRGTGSVKLLNSVQIGQKSVWPVWKLYYIYTFKDLLTKKRKKQVRSKDGKRIC